MPFRTIQELLGTPTAGHGNALSAPVTLGPVDWLGSVNRCRNLWNHSCTDRAWSSRANSTKPKSVDLALYTYRGHVCVGGGSGEQHSRGERNSGRFHKGKLTLNVPPRAGLSTSICSLQASCFHSSTLPEAKPPRGPRQPDNAVAPAPRATSGDANVVIKEGEGGDWTPVLHKQTGLTYWWNEQSGGYFEVARASMGMTSTNSMYTLACQIINIWLACRRNHCAVGNTARASRA